MRIDLGLDSKQVIGISWKSFDAINSSNKNLSLIDYKDLFEGMDVVLLNLQYGDVDDEIREFREKTGIEIICCNSIDNREDLDGLAALIEVCDLVVSTSNVTIHLAGALGKDTFLLLPLVTNTWLHLDLEKSLWYPSLTLYRQNRLNNWKDVLERVQIDLRERFKRL